MRRFKTSLYETMERLIGVKEVAGEMDNPLILAMLQLDQKWPTHDEVPWCSAGMNFVTKLLGLPRSRDLRARSWLGVGFPIPIEKARVGSDIVILKRGKGRQPGPEVTDAPGHVGCFGGLEGEKVWVLGANQSDSINITAYPKKNILGIRRLY